MVRASSRAVPLILAFGCAIACTGPTSILVRVTSSLSVPGQIDGLTLHVEGDTAAASLDRTYPITSFPQTVSLRPGPMSSTHVTITVTGTHGGAFVVRRVVHSMFVTGTEQHVDVDLAADCVGVMCPSGVDCSGGRCASGGDAGPADAGPADASTDTNTPDVGPIDGGHDAGPPDTGCSSDTACDDHVACTHDTCVAGACTNVPDDTLCMTGTTCSTTAGCPPRSCAMDADCDDHLFCNGVETCVATVCAASATSACDDMDACTTDTCDEAADACTHRTRDGDMDGFGDSTCPAAGGVPNTDCNDADATISPSEIDACDGVDNDCNAGCDDHNTCCRGTTGPCRTSCDAATDMSGTRICTGTCSWSACSPPAETCNGRDDDCNGACDDTFACCAGATSSCTTSCGSTGTHVCQADCTFDAAGTCTPPAEVCNGRDDDCDTLVDETFPCAVGSVGGCTTTCGSTGTAVCSASCAYGSCVPPIEICGNGVDDNCDMAIDEGCGACGACPGSVPVGGTGGRFTVTLGAASTTTGSCGGAGPEAALNFVLGAASDVFITTHGATQNTVVYVRSCSCTGTEIGCNDDADGRTTSALRLTNLPAGGYNVFVDTTGPSSGTVSVDVFISPTSMPSDACGSAEPILGGATSIMGTTCGFGNDYDNVTVGTTGAMCPYGFDGDAPERVYYFYLPTMRTVTINGCTAMSNYDQVIYIRSVCNDGTMTAQRLCNDDGCSGSPTSCTGGVRSNASMSLPAGLYYLFVDGYDDTTVTTDCSCGNYQFTLTGF